MDMRATVAGIMPAAGPGGAERANRHRAQWAAVGVLVALTAAGYSVFALARYYTFQTGSYDLVIFDQAVRSYAHFRPGISIIKGLHNGFGPHFSVLGDHWSPILAVLAAVMCAVAVFLVPHFAFRHALQLSYYRRDARMNAAAAAVAAVPRGVTIEAVEHLGPQLSARDTALLWDGDGSSPLHPPWVVADVAKREFTFASRGQQIQRVALLRRSGYRVVFSRDGYLMLHRSDTRQAAG